MIYLRAWNTLGQQTLQSSNSELPATTKMNEIDRWMYKREHKQRMDVSTNGLMVRLMR